MKRGYLIQVILIFLFILNQLTEAQVYAPRTEVTAEKRINSLDHKDIYENHDTLFFKYKALSEKLRSVENGNYILDSTITEIYDSNTQQWFKNYKHIPITYQSGSNKLVIDYLYIWNSNSEIWQISNKSEIYLNEYQRMVINCSWDNEIKQWAGSYKSLQTYSSNGLTGFYTYRWNDKNKDWYTQSKYEVSYDQNQATYIDSWWDNKLNHWDYLEKSETTYDNNKNQIKSLVSGWVDYLKDWVYKHKTEQKWDALGRNTYYLYSIWDGVNRQWNDYIKDETLFDSSGYNSIKISYYKNQLNGVLELSIKTESEYDINNKLINQTSYKWDQLLNGWINYQKSVYEYDSNGYETLSDLYSWKSATNSWVNNFRTETTYDISGNITMEVTTRPHYLTGEIIGESKLESVYDSDGNLLSYTIFKWDMPTNQFIFDYKGTNYYSEQASQSEIPDVVKVYPNPASEFIVFDVVNMEDQASVELFDHHGSKVLERDLSFPSIVNVDYLPRGLYIYRLKSNNKQYKGKIILR